MNKNTPNRIMRTGIHMRKYKNAQIYAPSANPLFGARQAIVTLKGFHHEANDLRLRMSVVVLERIGKEIAHDLKEGK